MANTEKIYERILAADKLAAGETTTPETPAETAAPEPAPAACDCAHHREGYEAGIRDTLEEMKSRAPVAAPVAPAPPMTIDEAMAEFDKWQHLHGEYWEWEIECLEALRSALVDGDKVHGLFAYTAIIEKPDGRRIEFQRVPHKKK